MSSFDEHFTVDHLNQHFERLLNSHFDVVRNQPRLSIGSDRRALHLFDRDRLQHLRAASRQVLSGRYTFSPFLEHEIPKADSADMRTISIASIRDSIVQRALYAYCYEAVDSRLTPAVFGYRKGRSAHAAIHAVARHISRDRIFIFDADLTRFFDTVNHDVLLGKVHELGIDGKAENLIRRFLKTGRIPSEQVREHRESVGKQRKFSPLARYVGVPQGGVLSGLLSNLYLADFDRAILSRFDGYVRYADDFLVCCESEMQCDQVHVFVREQLLPLSVELNSAKTRVCVRAESGVDFLGFRVSQRGIRVKTKNVAKFKQRVRLLLERIAEKVEKDSRLRKSSNRTLRYVAWRLNFKIRGPTAEQIQALAERGQPSHPFRRSWIGFFRIVDDIHQIRALDHWIRSQVSRFLWKTHRVRVRHSHMRQAGLISLIRCLWKSRSKIVGERP